MKCQHEQRVNVHSSVTVGGFCVGKCEREALPGMYYCSLHATTDALGMHIRNLHSELEKYKRESKLCPVCNTNRGMKNGKTRRYG